MDAIEIRRLFQDRERTVATHWITLAQQVSQELYGCRDFQAIAEMRELFTQMTEDIRRGVADEKTTLEYCRVVLTYCDLSNDWRDWSTWAQQVMGRVNSHDRVWLLYGQGRYLEEIGKLRESLMYHSDGLALCESLSIENVQFPSHWIGMHWMGMGIVLQRSNRLRDAGHHLQRAVDVFEEEQDTYQQANALANLASCQDRCGKHASAISRYGEAVALLREIDNRFDLCRILYSLGIAYMRGNQPYLARDAFLESQELGSTTGNYYFLALNYYGMAWLQYRLGDLDKAKHELEEGFRAFEQAIRLDPAAARPSFPEIQGNMYLLSGAIYARGPDYDIASHYLDQAEHSYQQLDHHDNLLLKVLANQARVYEHSGNLEEAERLFFRLVENSKHLRSLLTCGDGGVHLVRIYQRRQAGIAEWAKLIWQLGLYGLVGAILGYKERILRRLSLSRKR